MKTLLAAFVLVWVDVLAGLPLNLYGFGREYWVFALLTVAFALCMQRLGHGNRVLASLILCALWLGFYPQHNGWDVVLTPQLLWAAALWCWCKVKTKFAKRQ